MKAAKKFLTVAGVIVVAVPVAIAWVVTAVLVNMDGN